MFGIFEITQFPYFILKLGKWDNLNLSNTKKWGISNKKQMTNFKTSRITDLNDSKLLYVFIYLLHLYHMVFTQNYIL